LERQALVAPQDDGIVGERPLDFERGVQRPAGMVLVGNGRSKERHDAVAGELVDGALPAVDGIPHELEGAVHDDMELFRVERAGQLGRALDVHEEDRDLLARAAQRAPFLQDALGEVVRGVGGGSAGRGGGFRR
jgi:hypothetical protein